jgi:hypothetical protein
MGAYAMAHTAVPAIEDRTALVTAFDEIVEAQEANAKSLVSTRKKVDKLYSATREQILAAEEIDHQSRRTKKQSGAPSGE